MSIQYIDVVGGDSQRKTITGATKANPCVITSAAHGYSNGDTVIIYNVGGMTQLNSNKYTVAGVTTDTFQLSGINSTAYTTYTSGGYMTNRGNTAATPLKEGWFGGNYANEYRFMKTTAPTSVTGATFGWTANSVTVTTSADKTASIAVGDYIGKTTAAGNGAEETYYRVGAITTTTITLEIKYGGASANESSCLKLNPIVCVAEASASSCATPSSNAIVSGGWDSSFASQDGETWIKSSVARTVSSVYGVNVGAATNVAVDHMNIVECFYGFLSTGAGNVYQYCTSHAYNVGFFQNTGSAISAHNCCGSAVQAGGSGGFYLINSGNILDYCVGLCSTVSTSGCFYLSGTGVQTVTSCKAISGSYGFTSLANAQNLQGCSISNCNVGVYVYNNNAVVNCDFVNCVSGITCPLSVAYDGLLVRGCSFTGGAYGINFSSTSHWMCSPIVDSCTFTSCTYGIAAGTSTQMLAVSNCGFTTPVTYAVYRVTSTVPVILLSGCAIDGASVAKSYNTQSPGTYYQPQYIIQNSFGQSGTIWYPYSLMRDDTNYRTTAPCVALTSSGTTTIAMLDLKIFSAYVKSGITKTYSLWIKASNASWAGTLVPKWKLGGALVKTETTITSLTTSWVQYTFTCDSSLITRDDELSLEMMPNTNAYSVYFDDFVVS